MDFSSIAKPADILDAVKQEIGDAWDRLSPVERELIGRMTSRMVKLRAESLGRPLSQAERATLAGIETSLAAISTGLTLDTMNRITNRVFSFISSMAGQLAESAGLKLN